jgi:hypothetical protein
MEEDASKGKGGSKYSSLFAKMWGGNEKAGKSSGREEASRAGVRGCGCGCVCTFVRACVHMFRHVGGWVWVRVWMWMWVWVC